MGNMQQKLVTEDSFDATGTFIPAGQIGSFDDARLTGQEPHLFDASGAQMAVVEVAPISPTGPNPVAPQQIPFDARQGPGGVYQAPGRALVGEVTNGADIRFANIDRESTAEGDMVELLRKSQEETAQFRAQLVSEAGQRDAGNVASTDNADDALVSGNVPEIVATLGAKTDDELTALRAAEIDREKPRKTLLDAIKAEQDARSA